MVEEDKTTRSTEETSSEPLVLILTVNGKANLICKEIFLLNQRKKSKDIKSSFACTLPERTGGDGKQNETR